MAMGYKREGEKMPIQQRAMQFIGKVREMLVLTNRKSPSYDELLRTLSQLGYTRSLAAVGVDARNAAVAQNQWEAAN